MRSGDSQKTCIHPKKKENDLSGHPLSFAFFNFLPFKRRKKIQHLRRIIITQQLIYRLMLFLGPKIKSGLLLKYITNQFKTNVWIAPKVALLNKSAFYKPFLQFWCIGLQFPKKISFLHDLPNQIL